MQLVRKRREDECRFWQIAASLNPVRLRDGKIIRCNALWPAADEVFSTQSLSDEL
jgi:hypothetical protein